MIEKLKEKLKEEGFKLEVISEDAVMCVGTKYEGCYVHIVGDEVITGAETEETSRYFRGLVNSWMEECR